MSSLLGGISQKLVASESLLELSEPVVVGLDLVGGCHEGELQGSQHRELVQQQLFARETKNIGDFLHKKGRIAMLGAR